MEKAKTDSVFLKGGFRFASKGEGECASACFDGSIPPESDLARRTFRPKLQAEMVVTGGAPADNNLGLDGIPVLVADCAVDRPDDLAAPHGHPAKKAGLGLEEAAQLPGIEQNAVFTA